MATKFNITAKILEKHSALDRRIVLLVIDRFFEMLSYALKNYNRIELRRFGSFSIRSYNVRNVDGSINKLARSKYFKVYFRSSKSVVNEVNSCRQ